MVKVFCLAGTSLNNIAGPVTILFQRKEVGENVVLRSQSNCEDCFYISESKVLTHIERMHTTWQEKKVLLKKNGC